MQALEAMQRLVNIAQRFMSTMADAQSEEEQAQYEEAQPALDQITMMLETALPVARWRCHVEVDAVGKTRGKIHDEFTICAPSIHGILGGLMGLAAARTDVRITLWEQRVERADMLSGYQGPSKVSRYKTWLQSLLIYDAPTPPMN